MQERDAFDVVKDFLVARSQGLTSAADLRRVQPELLAVAARMERLKVRFPAASEAFGLGEDMRDVLKAARGGRGFLGRAALL